MHDCLIDGEISSLVPVSNRGLNYGDGLFETIAISNNQPQFWQLHMDRLSSGCQRLGLSMPSQSILLREVKTVISGLPKAVVKIVLVRQGAARGYMPDSADCTRIVSVHSFPESVSVISELGVAAAICKTRLAIQPALRGIKP